MISKYFSKWFSICLNKFSFTLYIFKITFGVGWYRGENWKLLSVNIFEIDKSAEMIILININFLKFGVELLLDI